MLFLLLGLLKSKYLEYRKLKINGRKRINRGIIFFRISIMAVWEKAIAWSDKPKRERQK